MVSTPHSGRKLTSTQEHFLKKFLIEEQLKNELHEISLPHRLQHLGPPFGHSQTTTPTAIPLLKHLFQNYLATFPLITSNTKEDQDEFWRDIVQPFVDSFNEKHISDSSERTENILKRKQVNTQLLSALVLFYNSMISCDQELEYLASDHLKPSDKGKLDKISKGRQSNNQLTSRLDDFENRSYVNGLNIDIVAVESLILTERLWSVFGKSPARLHFLFVIQVTRRVEVALEIDFQSHFISRTYLEFQMLEKALKKKFPGLMVTTHGPLPSKPRNDDGVKKDTEKETKFQREKLRLALRGYISTLMNSPEIGHSAIFTDFLDDKEKNFSALSEQQAADHKERALLEKYRLRTQQEFQDRTAEAVYELSKNYDGLKSKLVSEPQQLTQVFKQFGESQTSDDLPPLLRTLFEWCKLEIAATLYQVFLTQDNSSELLSKCRKFHRLFPYNVTYGILKYTNPVAVVSRLIDLLLIDMPTFRLGGNKKVNNLLSMIFVMLLDEDLAEYTNEREELVLLEPLARPEYDPFIKRIEKYVASKDDGDVDPEAESGDILLLQILKSERFGNLSSLELKTYEDIVQAQRAYASLKEHKKEELASLYVALRQLFQLDIRARDKNLMKQLWQEPELTLLIKKVITIFYKPLMVVMKQCKVHLVLKDWQRFVDDLLQQLEVLDLGALFYTSPIEMFQQFKDLLDRHEDSLYRFMHNLYTMDDKKLFIRMVGWVQSFIEALGKKHSDPSSVSLDFSEVLQSDELDWELFVTELDGQILQILEQRRQLRQFLENAAKRKSTNGHSHQQDINSRWDSINNGFDADASNFGLSNADIEDFNLLKETEKALADANLDHEDSAYVILHKAARVGRKLGVHPDGELIKIMPAIGTQLRNLLETQEKYEYVLAQRESSVSTNCSRKTSQ